MNKKLPRWLILAIISVFIFLSSFSKTSAEDEKLLMPLTEVSAKDKVEINPQAENPVMINKEPLKVNKQQEEKLPMISVDIQAPNENMGKLSLKNSSEKADRQSLQIGINKETLEVVIEQEETVVKTREPINIENNSLTVQTSEGKMPINILPNKIMKMVIQEEPQKIDEITLKVIDKQPIYETTGIKEEKVLNIIPIRMSIKTKVSAQTGKIVGIEKPWWGKLLDPISY